MTIFKYAYINYEVYLYKFHTLFEMPDVHDLASFPTEWWCGEEIVSTQAPVSRLYVRSRFLPFLHLIIIFTRIPSIIFNKALCFL